MDPFKGHVGRTHFIRMGKGGHFPPHRDNRRASVSTMRLFVPIENCNPPRTFFMLDREPLVFEHGRAYFINTCIEHTVFSCYPSLFLVMNIVVNDTTTQTLLNNMEWKQWSLVPLYRVWTAAARGRLYSPMCASESRDLLENFFSGNFFPRVGAFERIRTSDPRFRRPLLSPLSYEGQITLRLRSLRAS